MNAGRRNSQAPRRATRRRGDALVAAIYDATRAELDAHGYAGVTFESVARRAGTSKPVLYRRYRNRAHLIAETLTSGIASLPMLSSTGSLRDDIYNLFDQALTLRRGMGDDTLRALVGEADYELLDEVVGKSMRSLTTALRDAVDSAAERGEVGSGYVSDLALLAPVSLLRPDLISMRNTSDASFIAQIVDEVAIPLFTACAQDTPQPATRSSNLQKDVP